tara:strand:- start:901 stop:2112 length:1212 start_codon:yes stop_codon:yes gene_type:complete
MIEGLAVYSDYVTKRSHLFRQFAQRFGVPTDAAKNDVLAFYRDLKIHTAGLGLPSVTNIENERIHYYDLTFFSRYQRQGHTIVSDNIYGQIYDQKQNLKRKAQGIFTTNCQAANFAILQVLNLLYPDAMIVNPSDRLYFESDYIINRFTGLFKKPNESKKIIYLDSSALLNESELLCFESQANDCLVIIFDTSCFDRQGEYVEKVVTLAEKLNLPLIMTRSHLKLDSLGFEYDSLGSIVVLDAEESELFTKISEYISHMGAYALINQVYPFLFNQELKDLNSWRINCIRENSNAIFPKLDYYQAEIGEYHKERLHRLNHVFMYQRERVDFVKAGERFMALCKVYDIPGKFCDSFGFDFFSLTNVESFDQQNRGFLRFCSPVDSSQTQSAINVINNLIKHLAIK